jgi:hypothetical protein
MKFQVKASPPDQIELHLFYGRETVPEVRTIDLVDAASPEEGGSYEQDMEDFVAKIFVEGMRFEALDYAHTSASRLKKLIAVTNR